MTELHAKRKVNEYAEQIIADYIETEQFNDIKNTVIEIVYNNLNNDIIKTLGDNTIIDIIIKHYKKYLHLYTNSLK